MKAATKNRYRPSGIRHRSDIQWIMMNAEIMESGYSV